MDQGGRGIIYNKDSPLLLRRIEAGLVASRGLLGSSVLGSLFTLKWKHLLCIQSNRARRMGGGDRLKVVQDRREAKKRERKRKEKRIHETKVVSNPSFLSTDAYLPYRARSSRGEIL